jgi:hypothetical protein
MVPLIAGLAAAWYFELDASDIELQKYWRNTKGIFKS